MSGYTNDGYSGGEQHGADPKDQNYNTKDNGNKEWAGNGNGGEINRTRVFRNVIAISVAFMLLFTAFQSMANLQSSINKVRM